jgi:hypothetical protein
MNNRKSINLYAWYFGKLQITMCPKLHKEIVNELVDNGNINYKVITKCEYREFNKFYDKKVEETYKKYKNKEKIWEVTQNALDSLKNGNRYSYKLFKEYKSLLSLSEIICLIYKSCSYNFQVEFYNKEEFYIIPWIDYCIILKRISNKVNNNVNIIGYRN